MSVTDEALVDAVRRFSSTSVIEETSRLAADLTFEREVLRQTRFGLLSTFGMAELARIALVFSNPYRHKIAGPADIARMCSMYNDMPRDDTIEPYQQIERLLNLQGHFQQDTVWAIGRTIAVLNQDKKGTTQFEAGWDSELLGVTLHDHITAAYVSHLTALLARGPFHPGQYFSTMAELGLEPPASLEDAMSRMTLDTALAKRTDPYQVKDLARRFHPNPLYARPIVRLGERLAVPAPALLAQKVSLQGLNYEAAELDDDSRRAFAKDIGILFERYVGSQLSEMHPVQLWPEEPYDGSQLTVDWVAQFESLVLLVEVKFLPPGLNVRLGGAKAEESLVPTLGKAMKQIRKTNELLDARPDVLRSVPRDLPRYGLVVTAHRLPAAHAPLLRPHLRDPGVPHKLVASEDLERLATVPAGHDQVIKRWFDSSDDVASDVEASGLTTNRLLDEALDQVPFVRVLNALTEDPVQEI